MPVSLEFFDSPAGFLAAAGEHLAQDSVLNTVVASVAHRAAAADVAGFPQPPGDWWLVVRDPAGAVVGAGMRAAPFDPRPLFLLPMPDEAATDLARALHARGEEVSAANGALAATSAFSGELARLTGRRARVAVHSRLHQCTAVVQPGPASSAPEGCLRRATYDEAPLVASWFAAFFADADAQAGRPPGSHAGEAPDPYELRRRIGEGDIWVWEVAGQPVHLSMLHPPSFGAARIGPVFTPPEHRGHGYAGATVAALADSALAGGSTPCLFTDQANPVSNALYARIGFVPVVDMANYVLE
jgi:GNAT superfamily N-acetyltransferase